MNKRDILEIGVKLFGIYCIISFAGSIPAIGMAINTAFSSKFILSPPIYILMPCLLSAFYLILAVIFLSQGRVIACSLARDEQSDLKREVSELPPHARLSFWIILMGIYYFISSASSLLSHLMAFSMTDRGVYFRVEIASNVLVLVLSIALILGSRKIEWLIIPPRNSST